MRSRRAESCPNADRRAEQGVAEGSAHALPACRAYELASPLLKNEQEVNVPDRFVAEASFQAAEQGGGVVYSLTGAIPGSQSGGLYGHAVSTSPAPGSPWSADPLEPSNRLGGLHGAGENSGEFESFSPSLGCGATRTRLAHPPSPKKPNRSCRRGPHGEALESPEEEIDNLYLWRSAGRIHADLKRPPRKPEQVPRRTHLPRRRDLRRLLDGPVRGQQRRLLAAGRAARANRRRRPRCMNGESAPRPQACRENQETCRPDRGLGAARRHARPSEVLDAHAGEFFSDLHELSGDGRRVFFTAVSDGKGPGEEKDDHARQIYLREGGHTTAVSISPNHEVRDTGAKFEAASADGGRAFFVANYGLTGGDGTSTAS